MASAPRRFDPRRRARPSPNPQSAVRAAHCRLGRSLGFLAPANRWIPPGTSLGSPAGRTPAPFTVDGVRVLGNAPLCYFFTTKYRS